MSTRVPLLAILLVCATRTVFALTCGGLTVVPADHVVIKYSAPLATGATRSTPLVSISNTGISVTRTLSGGSATDSSCVDDTVDLGSLGAGRFNLTWTDNVNFTSQRSSFTFYVGAPQPQPVTSTLLYAVEVLPPAVPDQPVRLVMNSASPAPDVAYVSGNDIHVSQWGPAGAHRLSIVDLGILPPGIYNVTESWAGPNGLATGSFPFVVQQPEPASACSGRVSVTRTAAGTSRLRYEDTYYGYNPAFGPPTATSLGWPGIPWWPPMFEVRQLIADSAMGTPYVAPAFCHGEDLDLGPIADGYHKLFWYDMVSVNGSDYREQNQQQLEFWTKNGTSQCTTVAEILTPSLAPEGAPFEVAMDVAILGDQGGVPKVTVAGQIVTLDTGVPYFECCNDSVPSCHMYKATVNPLPAGEYTLVWRIGGKPVATSHLTVGKLSRQRAARH